MVILSLAVLAVAIVAIIMIRKKRKYLKYVLKCENYTKVQNFWGIDTNKNVQKQLLQVFGIFYYLLFMMISFRNQ